MESASVEEIIANLRQKGVRITPQRKDMLTYLVHATHHPTADDIYRELSSSYNQMSVATVYNNLKVFCAHGIIREMTYGDQASRFDFVTSDHYHVKCQECGRIEDLYYPKMNAIEEEASKLTGFQIFHHRLELYGLCPTCQKAKTSTQ